MLLMFAGREEMALLAVKRAACSLAFPFSAETDSVEMQSALLHMALTLALRKLFRF